MRAPIRHQHRQNCRWRWPFVCNRCCWPFVLRRRNQKQRPRPFRPNRLQHRRNPVHATHLPVRSRVFHKMLMRMRIIHWRAPADAIAHPKGLSGQIGHLARRIAHPNAHLRRAVIVRHHLTQQWPDVHQGDLAQGREIQQRIVIEPILCGQWCPHGHPQSRPGTAQKRAAGQGQRGCF